MAIKAQTEVRDLYGMYEQLADTDEMITTSEAASQTIDTVTKD